MENQTECTKNFAKRNHLFLSSEFCSMMYQINWCIPPSIFRTLKEIPFLIRDKFLAHYHFRDVLRFLKDMPLLDRGQTESTTTSSPVTPTSHVKPPTSHMTSEPSYTDIELTSMRRTIARRLCESKVRMYMLS